MKHLITLLSVFLLSGFTANADAIDKLVNTNESSSFNRGYGKSFIFVEEDIEFSIFPDGQFDFYIDRYSGPEVNVSIGTQGGQISFNSGYDYNAYVQYDEFGAIVQIENTPVYYDFYGRVRQVGNVFINYNYHGFVNRVGGLYVHYNRYNAFSHCTGFINIINPRYIFRPWHSFFVIPSPSFCVVYNRPYRQYYTPVRYTYTRPYANNYRRTTAVASRRGNRVTRQRNLATRRHSASNRNDLLAQANRPRRGNDISKPRTRANTTPRPRRDVTTKPRTNTSAPRPKRDVTTKPRTRSNTSAPRPNRNVTKPRSIKRNTSMRPRSNSNTKPKVRNSSKRVTKPNRSVSNRVSSRNKSVSQKPRATKSRTYNRTQNKNTNRVANRSNRRR